MPEVALNIEAERSSALAAGDHEIVVAYAKVVEDKDDGIYMTDVYFGGLAHTKEEAERIARDCVNNVKGGTILPRLFATRGPADVLAAMETAGKRFAQLEVEMFRAEEIYQRTQASLSRHRTSR